MAAKKKRARPVSKKQVQVARSKAIRAGVGEGDQWSTKASPALKAKRAKTAALKAEHSKLKSDREMYKKDRAARKTAAKKKKDASPFSGRRTKRGSVRRGR